MSAKGGGSSKKKMVTFSDQIPKKCRMDAKHCILCEHHGGAHNTHDTMESHEYEKDRTPNPAFTGNSRQCNLHRRNAPREQNNSYMQFSTKIAKFEKSNKKLKRMTKSASMIMKVTTQTPTHPEVMGPVAQGN